MWNMPARKLDRYLKNGFKTLKNVSLRRRSKAGYGNANTNRKRDLPKPSDKCISYLSRVSYSYN
jgi:hypothetical protein